MYVWDMYVEAWYVCMRYVYGWMYNAMLCLYVIYIYRYMDKMYVWDIYIVNVCWHAMCVWDIYVAKWLMCKVRP